MILNFLYCKTFCKDINVFTDLSGQFGDLSHFRPNKESIQDVSLFSAN